MRDFLARDKEQNLKVVTAGIKVLERMAGKGKGSKADDEYRLVQVRTSCYKMFVMYTGRHHFYAMFWSVSV